MIEAIGAYWWLWLVIMLVGYSYVIWNQVNREKIVETTRDARNQIMQHRDGLPDNFPNFEPNLIKGLASMMVAGLVAGLATLMFLILISINIVIHFMGGPSASCLG